MAYGDDATPIFRSAFRHPNDEANGSGVRPVVFDVLAPDYETSLLPDDIKLVLHINPSSMSWDYQKIIERIQTKGGWVEQHYGDGTTEVRMEMSTGGLMRLYSGMSNITGGGYDTGGNRRQTIAYDKYLDILTLFHNNGAIFDDVGTVAFQGIIKMSFDGESYYGWFSAFDVAEAADKPYQFMLSCTMTISHETRKFRTTSVYDSYFVDIASESLPSDDSWDGGLFSGWGEGLEHEEMTDEYSSHIFTTATKYGPED